MSEETKVQQVQEDLNDQMLVRRDKLAEYEADGVYPFGQRFVVNAPEEVVAAEKVKENKIMHRVGADMQGLEGALGGATEHAAENIGQGQGRGVVQGRCRRDGCGFKQALGDHQH